MCVLGNTVVLLGDMDSKKNTGLSGLLMFTAAREWKEIRSMCGSKLPDLVFEGTALNLHGRICSFKGKRTDDLAELFSRMKWNHAFECTSYTTLFYKCKIYLGWPVQVKNSVHLEPGKNDQLVFDD